MNNLPKMVSKNISKSNVNTQKWVNIAKSDLYKQTEYYK